MSNDIITENIRGERLEKPVVMAEQSDPSTASIVTVLEYIYRKFDEQFFKSALLRMSVITLSQGGTRVTSGWCSRERIWEDGRKETYYEINICPVELIRPIEDICEVLLHEQVHLWNLLNGIKDCSSSSQYHNKKYKETAEQHGLKAEKTKSYGYSETSLKPETIKFIKSLDLSAFPLFRRDANFDSEVEATYEKPLKPSSTRKYICPQCKIKIRATKEVRVRCDSCGELFEEQASK